MTRKQLKRMTKAGIYGAYEALALLIGPDKAAAVWNSTAYFPRD